METGASRPGQARDRELRAFRTIAVCSHQGCCVTGLRPKVIQRTFWKKALRISHVHPLEWTCCQASRTTRTPSPASQDWLSAFKLAATLHDAGVQHQAVFGRHQVHSPLFGKPVCPTCSRKEVSHGSFKGPSVRFEGTSMGAPSTSQPVSSQEMWLSSRLSYHSRRSSGASQGLERTARSLPNLGRTSAPLLHQVPQVLLARIFGTLLLSHAQQAFEANLASIHPLKGT